MKSRLLSFFITVPLLWILGTPSVDAAPGYSYRFIAEALPVYAGQNPCKAALNNLGDVFFARREFNGATTGTRFDEVFYFVPSGGDPREIYRGPWLEQTYVDGPEPRACLSVQHIGINDDGFVTIPVQFNQSSSGSVIVDAHRAGLVDGMGNVQDGIVAQFPNLGNSGSQFSTAGTIAGRRNNDQRTLVVTDGTDEVLVTFGVGNFPRGIVNLSGNGQWAADLRIQPTGTFCTTQHLETASLQPDGLSVTRLGTYQDFCGGSPPLEPWYTRHTWAGVNNRGIMSLATTRASQFQEVTDRRRVVVIDPTTSTIAEVASSDMPAFLDFWPTGGTGAPHGTSVNNFNRVLFTAQGDASPTRDAIWVGDASGDPPTLVLRYDELISLENDPREVSVIGISYDFSYLGPNAINDQGQVVILSHFQHGADQKWGVFLATPANGLEPGMPILPGPEDILPTGGWRFDFGAAGCPTVIRADASMAMRPRCYYDPPVSGYEYAVGDGVMGRFESVLIPAPLAGGDDTFTLEFAGTSAELRAGTPFYFTDIVPGGIDRFRIVDIDPGEALDSENPEAFVSGLTFIEVYEESGSFTMVPILIDAPEPEIRMCDANGDGAINRLDIALIMEARNTPSTGPEDPRDVDGDGTITLLDARQCALRCDKPRCSID